MAKKKPKKDKKPRKAQAAAVDPIAEAPVVPPATPRAKKR
jgi:hypothetical protein